MKKIGLVFKYELKNQLGKKSVQISTLILMLIIIGICFAFRLGIFSGNGNGNALNFLKSGYTLEDKTGFAFANEELKASYKEKLKLPDDAIFSSKEDLKQNILENKLKKGYFIESFGSFKKIMLDMSLNEMEKSKLLPYAKQIQREQFLKNKGLDEKASRELLNLDVKTDNVVLGKDSRFSAIPAFILMFFVYLIVLIYGASTATIIAREKDSKTMELLITSVKPSKLIIGKVLASGASAIIQSLMLLLAFVIGYKLNAAYMPPIIKFALMGSFTTEYIASYVFFSLFGFLMYLFLYAALGSTVSKVEDVQSATGFVQFLFIAGYIIASSTMSIPNSPVLKIASFIPFTSIMTMPFRSALVSVSFVEYLLSGGLLILANLLFCYLSIKIYRWGTLNYGNKPNFIKAIKAALKNKD